MYSDNPYLNQLYKTTELAFYYIERALRRDINSIIVISDNLYINGNSFNYYIDTTYLKELCNKNNINYIEEKDENKKVL